MSKICQLKFAKKNMLFKISLKYLAYVNIMFIGSLNLLVYLGRTSQDLKRQTNKNGIFTLYMLGFVEHLKFSCLAGK